MAACQSDKSHVTSIYWARDDLRVRDNPALAAATQSGGPVVAVYIFDDGSSGLRPLGGASGWWLERSLVSFGTDLREIGIPLILRRGNSKDILAGLVSETNATAIYWNRRYYREAQILDASIKSMLQASGKEVQSFNAALLVEPWEVKTGTGGPYKVFSPFSRALSPRLAALSVLPVPKVLRPYEGQCLLSDPVEAWGLSPSAPNWAEGFSDIWEPGENGAHNALAAFCENGLSGYADGRDFPARPNVSRLSPHLRFGEISPRLALNAVAAAADRSSGSATKGADKFTSELVWREFAYHLLHHYPEFPDKPWRAEFDAFPWIEDEASLRAWQSGQTGYPFVDAGMRELWATGYMHNRVRMVVASFLCKHLQIDWRRGEAWFWDTLLDADLANNVVSWQWVAGSGADAAPYFRIFNPVVQGERFDAKGEYIRRWVPEVAGLPDKYVHAPWLAPPHTLVAAKVELGVTYPLPIVDHQMARQRALNAFKSLSSLKTDLGPL